MANRFTNPNPQFLDDTPIVYEGGKLFFYITGTTTPANTYADNTLVTANPNPITLDSSGRSPVSIWLDPAVTYKVVLKDINNVTIWTRDPVVDPAANTTAAVQVHPGNPNGAVAGNQGSVGGSGASMVFDIVSQILWICTTSGTTTTAVWTQVAANLSGAVVFAGVISPATLSADVDNYEPAGFDTASIVRLSASTNVTITGLLAGVSGRWITLENIGPSRITLSADATSSAAANRFALDGSFFLSAGQSTVIWYDGISLRWRVAGAHTNLPFTPPGGRLTIQSGFPVLNATVSAAGTVYYSQYLSNHVTLYNGAGWYTTAFTTELSQALTDTNKSPAPTAADKIYDMFIWNDAGTLRCTRGPLWSGTFTRGSGAGTTELMRVDGISLNAQDIVNGPDAGLGLYVGTIATDGANKLNMSIDTAAGAGGGDGHIDVWNNYNRIAVAVQCRDSDDNWSQGTTGTWHRANLNDKNRITFVAGLNRDPISCLIYAAGKSSGSNIARVGVGVNSTTDASGFIGANTMATGSGITSLTAQYSNILVQGRNYVQWLNYTDAGTTTWYGDGGDQTILRTGITLIWFA